MAAESNEINDMTSETETTTVETSLETSTPAVATLEPVKATTGKLSAQDLIRAFEADQLKSDLPEIYVGDTVRVGVRISEGNKERIQPYEGVVIAKRSMRPSPCVASSKGLAWSVFSCCTAPRSLPSRWSGAVRCVERSSFICAIGWARPLASSSASIAEAYASFAQVNVHLVWALTAGGDRLAPLVQLVERRSPKPDAGGSSPPRRVRFPLLQFRGSGHGVGSTAW